MKVTREFFDKMTFSHHVVLRLEELQREKVGSVFIGREDKASMQIATHKGVVVKHPKKDSNISGAQFESEYILEIGDTVYFAWEAFRAWQKPEDHQLAYWEVEGKHYLCVAFRELILLERGDMKIGLNGWCAGSHISKEVSSLIILSEGNWEQELMQGISGNLPDAQKDHYDRTKIVVSYPALHKVKYFGGFVPVATANIGDTVCFPEGFALQLKHKEFDGEDLFAVNTMQVVGYDNEISHTTLD